MSAMPYPQERDYVHDRVSDDMQHLRAFYILILRLLLLILCDMP